jgi:nodulation protein E
VNGRRVVITGLGTLSALGPNAHEFWTGLSEGRTGIRPLTGFDDDNLGFSSGAQIVGYDEQQHFDRKGCAAVDRFAQLFVVAAREAIHSSGIVFGPELQRMTGVITGSCLGGQSTHEDAYAEVYQDKRSRLGPFMIPRAMDNAGASRLTIEYGIRGPSFTVSTACASSAHAVGLAYWLVRQGMIDAAVTGGSEAPFTWVNLKAWEGLRVVSPDVCRPFSKDRRGLILGEGGAALVLETLDHAMARGARVLAEIVGCGMSADANHLTMPEADGPAFALEKCLSDAGLRPEDIDYINAHGTGTRANDAVETRAVRQVFGAHADRLAISSTKSMHGHTLGAAGAIESAATVLAVRHGLVPPTIAYNEPDPECDLDNVPNTARPLAIDYALSSSFAFGGLNVALAFRRWDETTN